MCIKKAVVKMAAAAVVVAGGASAVWAQAAYPTPVGAASVSQDRMSATFMVGGVSLIECIAKNPDENVLLATDVVVKPSPIIDPGTLGMVKVSTNSTAWDVSMTTLHGGRLVKSSESTPGAPVCPSGHDDPYSPTGCDVDKVPGDPIPGAVTNVLVYSTTGDATGPGIITGGTDPDTVQLQVAIGLAKAGEEVSASQSAQGNIYAFGPPDNVLAPVLVSNAGLNASRALEINNNPFTSVAGVSFAKVLGGASAYTGAASGYDKQNTDANARSWSDVASMGFGTPKNKLPNNDGKMVGVEYFYVNVGFLQSLVSKIGTNAKGEYSETFIFDLVSAF